MKYCRYLMILCCGLFFYTTAQASGLIACNQPYALCDTSPCVPIPGVKGKAICFCSLFTGFSVGNLTCKERAPTTDGHHFQHVYSDYGLENVKYHKLMSCPAGSPWTFCLDKKCIVNPRNPNYAMCTCDIKVSEPYITFGGNCDTSTCGNTLYSGATQSDIEAGDSLLMKILNLSSSPVQNCPMTSDAQKASS